MAYLSQEIVIFLIYLRDKNANHHLVFYITSVKKIWLLDEPFINLDSVSKENLEILIKKFLSDGGIVIMATHEQFPLEGKNYFKKIAMYKVFLFSIKRELLITYRSLNDFLMPFSFFLLLSIFFPIIINTDSLSLKENCAWNFMVSIFI